MTSPRDSNASRSAFSISGLNWPPNPAPPSPSNAHIASARFSAFLCSRLLGSDLIAPLLLGFFCCVTGASRHSVATKVDDVPNFLNGLFEVLGDLVVGQTQDGVAAQR